MILNVRLLLLTSMALIAFAANSLLCRWALAGQQIDPLSFTLIRLLSGALMLLILYKVFERKKAGPLFSLQCNTPSTRSGKWKPWFSLFEPFLLFTYALGFSFAYLSLDTGIGALVLFAAVQISMIGLNILKGDQPNPCQWLGIIVSFSGFIYLLLPTLSSPSLLGFILMTVAGVSWGIYSLRAKEANAFSDSPLARSARNFIWAVPFSIIIMLIGVLLSGSSQIKVMIDGVYFAVISGAITSGIGYAIWYQVLKQLNATLASVSQLLVPVIATAMGIIILGEEINQHFILATLMVLGGVVLVLFVPTNKHNA